MRSLRWFMAMGGGLVLAGSLAAAPLRVLFFSKSSGYEHRVIRPGPQGEPSHAENVLTSLGARHDFSFSFSKDGSEFSADYLRKFDIVFFYASGNLTRVGTDGHPAMTPAGKEALLNWVARGGGFVAAHAGSDCFHTYEAFESNPPPEARRHRYRLNGERSDPYLKMLGGEFINHGPQQTATARVVDHDFPGMSELGPVIHVFEEWYSLKEFASNNHVLLAMSTGGMEGSDYQRPDYPLAWARRFGQGRVWYNAMGHREEIWNADFFQRMLIGGLEWAGRRRDATMPGNLLLVTPGALTLPPR